MQSNRRVFMMQLATATGALALASQAQAQAMVDEASPQAVALHYKANATKATDPKYVKGQICANCALYQGSASSKTGGCPLFGTQQVTAAGWCNAYAKKG